LRMARMVGQRTGLHYGKCFRVGGEFPGSSNASK
jgi:hypothetical protein